MWYKITPNDTLFFRDGRPFSMGMESWAETIFPPNPSTVYGAVRSWLIFEKGDLKSFKEGKFREELGTADDKGSLKIKGPLLIKDNDIFFACPKDLLIEKSEKEENKLHKLAFLKRSESFISDYPLGKILLEKEMEKLEEAEGFLTNIYLNDYLSKKIDIRLTPKKEIYIEEPKIGIARERLTKTTKEGHLYHLPMVRLNDGVSIVVKIEGISNIPEKRLLHLGGEGRTARIEKISDQIFKDDKGLDFNKGLFKVYFATPAIFEKGYIPKWIDENTFEGNFDGIKLKLVCCAIGKYKLIGGWDLAKDEPKPMYRAVPAGSVYYFEILDRSDIEKIKDTFHFKNISDVYPEEGYGLALIGSVL